jgi:hypothetical protein
LYPVIISAQFQINGYIKNTKNEKLAGANVIAYNSNKKILSYNISNEKGYYSLLIHRQTDSLIIEVSYLGYKTKNQKIKLSNRVVLDFVLTPTTEQLKEVVIKKESIVIDKDTISYNVSSFKSKSDRVLTDVLKKIPGIEVDKDGRIRYQGKSINKFYIENLDLLEGRYNLATNNLPIKQISKVQVYENHQPIKVLDSLIYSDRAAINIKLKKNFSFSMPMEIGAGKTNENKYVWNGRTTPLIFNRKIQSIINLQANNTGEILEKNIVNLTDNRLVDDYIWFTLKKQNAPIDKSKFLVNNDYLGSFNYLFKTGEDTQVKLSLDYLKQKGIGQETFQEKIILDSLLTINLIEKIDNSEERKKLQSRLIIEHNKKSKYIKNILSFNNNWQDDTGYLQRDNFIEQRINSQNLSINNNLMLIFPLGQKLLSVYSDISYKDYTQAFKVLPSPFINFDNNSLQVQQLFYRETALHHYTGFTKKINSSTLATMIDVSNKFGRLNTELTFSPADNSIINDWLFNNIDFYTNSFALKNTWQYKKNGFILNLDIPVSYEKHLFKDEKYLKKKKIDTIITQPKITLVYNYNSWNFSASSGQEYRFSDIYQSYWGHILRSYDRINRFSSDISVKRDFMNRFQIKYKNILKGFQTQIMFQYKRTNNNLIYTYHYNENGSVDVNSENYHHIEKTYSINYYFSKYFFSIKSRIKLNGYFQRFDNKVFINNNLLDLTNFYWQLNTSFIMKLHKNIYYNLQTTTDAFRSNLFPNYIYQHNIMGGLDISIKKQHSIKITSTYFINANQSENLFLDGKYQYSMTKKGIDLYVEWRNITQQKYYLNEQVFNNNYQLNTIKLRPSEIIFGIRLSIY